MASKEPPILGSENVSCSNGLIIHLIPIMDRKDLLHIGRSEAKNVARAAILMDAHRAEPCVSILRRTHEEPELLFPNSFDGIVPLLAKNLKEPNGEIRIAVDDQLLPFLIPGAKGERLRRLLVENGRLFLFPISSSLLAVFADYITYGTSSILEISRAALETAGNDMLRFFIHLPGMAHSAQDIIASFREDAQWAGRRGFADDPMDMVVAGIPGGSEYFVIQKTPHSPNNVDAIQLGLCYFPIWNKYNEISRHLASKLALCSACQEFSLALGYAVSFKFTSREGEK